jgi:S-formylglutathione hydrolase FrmB
VRRAIVIALLLTAVAAAPARADDLKLTATRQLDDRLTDLTFTTPVLPGPVHVRVLLPRGYDPGSRQRYPVLYLLHGGNGSAPDWTTQGNAAPATANLPLIVVMPEAGKGGWYTDWQNAGTAGRPRWETFHIGELLPWIDRHYRTRGRAIAGLSMGGFGAMSYAARHPDLFAAAASFSGAVDTNTPPQVASTVIDGIAGLDGGLPGSLFGLRASDEVRWRGHNPWDLATNLRSMQLTLRTGNGQTGGSYGGGGPTEVIEPVVHAMGVSMHEELDRLGIRHVWDDYGPGAHAWDYWNRDLNQTLPDIMTALRTARTPKRITYTSIDPRFGAWGWTVDLDRKVLEFATLSNAGRSGFSLSGTGAGTVTTAPLYRARATYVARGRRVRADRRGRLRIPVSLGPASTAQEYTAGLPAKRSTTTVRISRVRR